jgi:aryl-alcohol dehydrogenase-like predicted oxidoreductase
VGAGFNSLTNILPDPDVQIVEAHYNLLFRDIEKKLLADLNKYEIGLIVASPLSRGILSEKSYHKRIL